MRIIAGEFRGRRLATVGKGDMGAHLRPTTDRVRESLFNVLSHLDVVPQARVLDLFAGTGALGLEALSRGAAQVVFVDDGRVAQGLIRQNIDLTRSAGKTQVIKRDVLRLGTCAGDPFDLVFLDPPYGKGLGLATLEAVKSDGWFGHEACIVCEDNTPMGVPAGFELVDRRTYGGTHVTILQVAHQAL